MSMKARLHLFASLDVNGEVCKCVSECSKFSNIVQKHPLGGSKCDYWRSATQLCSSLPPDPGKHLLKCLLGSGKAWSVDGCVKTGGTHHYHKLSGLKVGAS